MTLSHGAVLFDLDGTLLDSRRAIVDAVADGIEEVAREHQKPGYRADHEAILGALGLPADEYFRRVLPPTLLQHAEAVKQAATRHEVEALRSGRGMLFPTTRPALLRLRQAGLRLGVVSNAQRPYFRAALEHLELEPLVDYSECYEELPHGSAPPFKHQLVERALLALGVDPRLSFVVGDRAEDLEAGRHEGCRTIGVLHGFGDEQELANANHLAPDLHHAAAWILAAGS